MKSIQFVVVYPGTEVEVGQEFQVAGVLDVCERDAIL